jgi:hypothetical protein
MRRILIPSTAAWIILLSATTLAARQNAPAPSTSDKSLGEIARKVRPKDAQTTNKRTFNDDDVQHGTSVPMPITPDSQLDLLSLSCEHFGSSVLRSKDPKLDVRFPERPHWEEDLCRAREDWHVQYLRYEGHKGTATEVEEREKAADRWSYFQSTAEVGVAFARLYLEKKARGAAE